MPVGAHVRIDPRTMISVSNIIQSETSNIKSYYSSIVSQNRNIKNHWEGENADTFFKALEQLTDQTKIITDRLDKYYSDLTAIANEFIERERGAVDKVQILSTDIFNV